MNGKKSIAILMSFCMLCGTTSTMEVSIPEIVAATESGQDEHLVFDEKNGTLTLYGEINSD